MRLHRRSLSACVSLALAAGGGCRAGDDGKDAADSGGDSGADSGGDSGADSGGDSGADSGGDSGADSGAAWDVVVVGAGAAGMAAAGEALATGATVRVLERSDAVGGAAAWAGGLMLFCGTPEQAALGVADSPATCAAEWPAWTGGDPEDPWVARFLAEGVPEVHDWLAGMGLAWRAVYADDAGGALPRVHEVDGGGPALVAALASLLDDDTVRFGAEVRALVRDDAGRVVGVRWVDLATGEAHEERGGAVVVATGGFLHDLDRVREVRPDVAAAPLTYGSWPGADGAGLRMLEGEGAAVENLAAIGFYAHALPSPADPEEELLASWLGLVPWVNADGARFVDESATNSFRVGETRAVQPDGYAWAIVDDRVASAGAYSDGPPGFEAWAWEDVAASDEVLAAPTLDDLAAALGIDAGALGATVAGFNAAARHEAADPFRDGSRPAEPVEAPPFYAAPVAASPAKAFGGVDVDLDGRVLDTAGAPIAGLYAAGELTGMAGGTLVGDAGFTGSLTAVVLGGRVAGRSAAAEALAGQ